MLHACATVVWVLAWLCQDLAWLLQRKQASRQAGVSTASMGKYDKRLPDEKPDERAPSSKRRKFAPVSEAGGAEGQRVSALVDNILARRGTGSYHYSALLLSRLCRPYCVGMSVRQHACMLSEHPALAMAIVLHACVHDVGCILAQLRCWCLRAVHPLQS